MLTKNFCNFSFILLMTLMVFFVSCNQKSEKHPYPFDPEIKTLSEDLHSQAYKDVVNTMIYQDLIEEWKRVATADNYIVFFGNSGMVCFNMDGELQWTRDLGEFTTTHGPGTNPVLYKNKVILIQDQNRGESLFVALDKQTGEILWQKERESVMGWSSPILVHVDGHDELIYNGSHNVKGYSPSTGEEIWNVNGSTREAVPIIVSGGGLFYSASGRNGTIMAIRPGGKGEITDTHKLWFNERGGPHVPSPVYYKERLYIITDTGVATCFNALNGKTVWRHRLEGRFSMSPVLIGDKIMVTNEMGLTTIFKAGDSFEALAQNDLEEETLSTPALLDGKLYFRTAAHLYCIGK